MRSSASSTVRSPLDHVYRLVLVGVGVLGRHGAPGSIRASPMRKLPSVAVPFASTCQGVAEPVVQRVTRSDMLIGRLLSSDSLEVDELELKARVGEILAAGGWSAVAAPRPAPRGYAATVGAGRAGRGGESRLGFRTVRPVRLRSCPSSGAGPRAPL
jgi:hypothetical protein